jgi:hypothetical protein
MPWPEGSPVSAGFPGQSRCLHATMVAYIDCGVVESTALKPSDSWRSHIP